MIFIAVSLWIIAGFVFMVAAGLTWRFKERHFDPLWMLLLGPLSFFAWRISEKREQRRDK